MPRNPKCRRVCAVPHNKKFLPQDKADTFITISVDELESLRLCDLEGLDQETAAARMDISRGTLQRILYSARKNAAEALTSGYGIIIEGGDYTVSNRDCNCGKRCEKCRFNEYLKEEIDYE